ncbi:MAG TPA: hypothetical protein VIJ97_02715, partial [Candidatus Anoxymicrobiaceae bacterium]
PPEPPVRPGAPQLPVPGQPPEGSQFYPPGTMPPQGYFYPPPWYPGPYTMPGPYFGYPQPGQTGQIPTVPPGAAQPPAPKAPPAYTGAPLAFDGALTPPPGQPPPGMPEPGQLPPQPVPFGPPPGFGLPPGFVPPGYPGAYPPEMQVPMELSSLEEPEFESLTSAESSHWRGDFKWVFGIITALFIFLTLSSAGLYRVTGPGAAKQVMTPIITNATQVKQFVKDNYQELRSKARKSTTAKIFIPDIGVSVSIQGDVITSLSSDDLADRVLTEAQREIYAQGYRQSLPMKTAQGVGEERAKATAVTILSKMNKSTHSSLFWPIMIFGVLAAAFGVLMIVFSRGWGKAISSGLAIIGGAIVGSLWLRVANQFIWKAGVSGTFKPAAHQALRTMGSLAVIYFDIALAAGAVVLLVGVIGAVIARKSRERITPFTDLKRPEEAVVGGPPVEPGMNGIPDDKESFFLQE